MEIYKYGDITEKIIGASMRVHAVLGNGFQEVIYQRALAIELFLSGLNFIREFNMPIFIKKGRLGREELIFLLKKRSW